MKAPENIEALEGKRVSCKTRLGDVTGRVYAISDEGLNLEVEGTKEKQPPIRYTSWADVESIGEAKAVVSAERTRGPMEPTLPVRKDAAAVPAGKALRSGDTVTLTGTGEDAPKPSQRERRG